MNFIYNDIFFKNKIINEITKIISLLIIIVIISLGIYDLDISVIQKINFKKFMEDVNEWWSTWTLQIILFAASILGYLNLKILISNNFLIKNKNYLKFIYFLKITTMSSSFFTLIVFNTAAGISKTLIIPDPVYLRSKVEHLILPLLYLFYFLITRNQFKINLNSKKEVFKVISITLIYPVFYLININFLGILTKNYVYTEFNWNNGKIFLTIAFNLAAVFGFSLFAFIFYLITKTNKKNINIINKNDFLSNEFYKSIYYSFIFSCFLAFIFWNLFIIYWTQINETYITIIFLILTIFNFINIILYNVMYLNKKNKIIIYLYLTNTLFSNLCFLNLIYFKKHKLNVFKI